MKKYTVPINNNEPPAITASWSTGARQSNENKGYSPIGSMSVEEKVDAYYFREIEQLKSGLLIIMALLPIYERYLRVKLQMTGDFTQDHRVFKQVAQELGGMDKLTAYHFWQHCRNGLLHRASIKESEMFVPMLRAEGDPVEIDENVCYINPYALRDRLLQIFRLKENRRMWKEGDEKLFEVYHYTGT